MVSFKISAVCLIAFVGLVKLGSAAEIDPGCPMFCTMQYAPVCGSDGKTYGNGCALSVASCNAGNTISEVSKGPCASAQAQPLVQTSGAVVDSGAEIDSSCPMFCTMQYAPVCGSDGKTYGNGCALSVASCNAGNTITQVSTGACGDSIPSLSIFK